MASVTIRGGLASGDPLNDVPRDQWPQLMEMRREFCRRLLPRDCRLLLLFVEDGRHGGFAGFQSEEEYIRDGLGLDPTATTWAVEGLKISGSEVPVPFAKAVTLGKHGGDRKSEKARGNQADNISLKHGTSAPYLLARLKRKAPELADRVVSGEMSARAAAIEAGIIKKPTPLDDLMRVWAKASPDERSAFRDWIDTYAVERIA